LTNAIQPAGPHRDGIERDAPALGERRPQRFFQDTAIVGRADGRKRRSEQLLAHLVGRGEATVEIENDRFGHWPLALDSEVLSHDGKSKGRSKAIQSVER